MAGSTAVLIACFLALASIKHLFFTPLKCHREWIEQNSIFMAIPKSLGRTRTDIKFTGNEGLRTYSVADELLKWAKLKEDGHISEEEFQEARDKILKKH